MPFPDSAKFEPPKFASNSFGWIPTVGLITAVSRDPINGMAALSFTFETIN